MNSEDYDCLNIGVTKGCFKNKHIRPKSNGLL